MNRSESFPSLDVYSLEIHLTWPSLEVYTDDTDELQVLIAGDEISAGDLKVNLTDGKLEISQPTCGFNYHISQPGWLQITLRIPADWRGGIEMTTVSGDLRATDLSGSDISVESASGNIRCVNLRGLSLRLITVSGDVDVSGADAEQFTVRTVSGDVHIRHAGAESWKLTAVSGDIDICMDTCFGRFAATSVSGDVRATVPSGQVDAYIRSVSGRIRTDNISIAAGAPDMRLSTVSGDLEITGYTLRE